MGMFGKSAADFAGPSSWADRLAILGATLKDASPGSTSNALQSIMSLQGARQQKAQQDAFYQQLSGMLGPQSTAGHVTGSAPAVSVARPPGLFGGQAAANLNDPSASLPSTAAMPEQAPSPAQDQPISYTPGTTTPGLSIDDPRMGAIAAMADHGGYKIDNLMKYLTANQADMAQSTDGGFYNKHNAGIAGTRTANRINVNGTIADLNDPNNTNRVVSEAPVKGAMPVYDNMGRVVDWKMPEGALGAVAASSEASQTGQTRGSIQTIPMSDGRTRTMLGRDFIDGGKPSGPAGAPRGTAFGPSPALGVSQTPAEAELAKARAGNQGKNESDVSGARSAMQQVDDQTNMISQNLHDMLGETQDPDSGKWVKTKPSMVTGLSAGSGTDLIEHVPFLNQQAKDLGAKIETVRNGTSFNSMQAIKSALAASGDGGSGSIRMTDQTARMLGEINGSLNQNQSGPQFEATVRRHIDQLDALNKARHDLFESQYQGIRPTTPGQTGPTANYGAASGKLSSAKAAPPPNARAPNTIYQTPKGPLKWTGTGWVQP